VARFLALLEGDYHAKFDGKFSTGALSFAEVFAGFLQLLFGLGYLVSCSATLRRFQGQVGYR
jgi:hypothetical protein